MWKIGSCHKCYKLCVYVQQNCHGSNNDNSDNVYILVAGSHATRSVPMSWWSLRSSRSFSPSSLCFVSTPSIFLLEATDAIFSWSSSKEIWLLSVSLSSSTTWCTWMGVGKGRQRNRYVIYVVRQRSSK